MAISLSFHILGLTLWVGGIMLVSRTLTLICEGSILSVDAKQQVLTLVNKQWRFFILPGFILSAVSGLYQLLSVGMGFYMKAGWFHSKLLFVFILIGVTFAFGDVLSGLNNDKSVTKKKLMIIHGVTALMLVLIVFLTMLGRGN